MTEENNKTNFFKEIIKSIKDLDKYEDFALKLPKDTFKYLFKIVLIFAMIITAFYTYKIGNNINNIYANLKEKLPEFSYSQGILTMNSEEPITIEEYKNTIGQIVIDANGSEEKISEYEKNIKSNGLGILVLKDKCMIISEATGQVSYKYLDVFNKYNISEFTKQDAINYIENMNMISLYASIYFIIFIYLFIMYFISILIDILILSILAYLVARISRIKLKFAPAFNIGVHSITLSILLNLIYIIVNLLTGFNIKYFGLMYSTISYIYVVVAVLMIKTDFMNRQMELIKLAKEQEKIKEEMEKKKQEEKEEEEKQNNPDNKEKKKKEKNKKDDGEIEGEVNPSTIQETK